MFWLANVFLFFASYIFGDLSFFWLWESLWQLWFYYGLRLRQNKNPFLCHWLEDFYYLLSLTLDIASSIFWPKISPWSIIYVHGEYLARNTFVWGVGCGIWCWTPCHWLHDSLDWEGLYTLERSLTFNFFFFFWGVSLKRSLDIEMQGLNTNHMI